MGVDHSLVDDPLLTLDAIADLAERFPGRVERHRSDLPMVMPGGAKRSPLSAIGSPARMRNRVDLPAPLRPTSDSRSPGAMAKATPSRIVWSPR